MKNGLYTIEHLKRAAKARLPRFAFDHIDGGAGRGGGLRRKPTAYERVRLMPRTFIDCQSRSLAKELFGHRYAMPFAVAPIGVANMVWAGTDLAFARAATAANIPY